MSDALPIRVLCVDDHALIREAIETKINMQLDMKVVAAATTGQEAVWAFKRHAPDVTLMDLRLPEMDGIEAIREIRAHSREARIVVLTMYQGDEDMYQALQAGATTYLLKDTLSDDLVRVVRKVHRGIACIPPGIAAVLAKRTPESALTDREVEVLVCVARGMRNKEIADTLGISPDTAAVHMKHILSKLRTSDRASAIRIALQRGIIHIH